MVCVKSQVDARSSLCITTVVSLCRLKGSALPQRVFKALHNLFINLIQKDISLMAKLSSSEVRQILIPNANVRACKLRSSYDTQYGKQYGAILSGEGLDQLGLKPTNDGGYWYSTPAEYNGSPATVTEDFICDMEGNIVDKDLADGAKAHLAFNLTPYPAGVRKDGTKYKAGMRVKLIAVRAVDYSVKSSAQDLLSSMLADNSLASIESSTADGDDIPV